MPTQITENYWENYHITEKRPKDTTVFPSDAKGAAVDQIYL